MKRFKLKIINVLLIVMAVLVVATGCGGDSHDNEAQAPLSASDCFSMHYQEVNASFLSAGFTNIETVADPDLILGWLNSDGDVSSVVIGETKDFDEGDWFPKDTPVVITYHTYPTEEGTLDNAETSDSSSEPSYIVEVDDGDPESSTLSDAEIPENSTFSIHFIDVGQADAALVECDGEYMLIDGGNKADSNVMYSVLKSAGADNLALVVGTHAHEDHIGGLPGAYNYATADLTLCATKNYDSDAFEDFAKYADQKGNGIKVPSVGDEYELGSADITILGVNGGSDTNDTSIVLKIQYGETSFLFTGDAEREAEQTILNSGADLSATVLKVGHHGSDTSTTYPFLREIMPAYAVISVGEGNSYGHPTEDALSRLRDAGVKVYRTDLQGDIFCTSDGQNVSFTVDRNANADTLDSAGTVPPAPVVTPAAPVVIPSPEPESEPVPAPIPDAQPDPEPIGTDYIGNKNSKKFHETWCSSVDKMKESNKFYYTGTRDGMISKGYEPCKNCNP